MVRQIVPHSLFIAVQRSTTELNTDGRPSSSRLQFPESPSSKLEIEMARGQVQALTATVLPIAC